MRRASSRNIEHLRAPSRRLTPRTVKFRRSIPDSCSKTHLSRKMALRLKWSRGARNAEFRAPPKWPENAFKLKLVLGRGGGQAGRPARARWSARLARPGWLGQTNKSGRLGRGGGQAGRPARARF